MAGEIYAESVTLGVIRIEMLREWIRSHEKRVKGEKEEDLRQGHAEPYLMLK